MSEIGRERGKPGKIEKIRCSHGGGSRDNMGGDYQVFYLEIARPAFRISSSDPLSCGPPRVIGRNRESRGGTFPHVR